MRRSKNIKYEDIEPGDAVRLAVESKQFRKQTAPRFSQELHIVQGDQHNGVYKVDGKLHSRKYLQLVRGDVIPAARRTETQVKEDKVCKTTYNPRVKESLGKPDLKKVEEIIESKRETRGKSIHFRALAGVKKSNSNWQNAPFFCKFMFFLLRIEFVFNQLSWTGC
jgi:hypothetical protein